MRNGKSTAGHQRYLSLAVNMSPSLMPLQPVQKIIDMAMVLDAGNIDMGVGLSRFTSLKNSGRSQ
jgi:hypothetical protein